MKNSQAIGKTAQLNTIHWRAYLFQVRAIVLQFKGFDINKLYV